MDHESGDGVEHHIRIVLWVASTNHLWLPACGALTAACSQPRSLTAGQGHRNSNESTLGAAADHLHTSNIATCLKSTYAACRFSKLCSLFVRAAQVAVRNNSLHPYTAHRHQLEYGRVYR